MTETINEELKDLMTDAGEDRLKFLTHHKRPRYSHYPWAND